MDATQENPLIAGVDEVGRGPLAGPVIAAAVILSSEHNILGLHDSKKISEKKRNELFEIITTQCVAYAIGRADVHEIDRYNIFQATLLAMQRAIEKLPIKPMKVLVDGKHCPELPYLSEAIVGGDALVPVISAASIIAKVIRDREMQDYEQVFPGYGFAKHKGYSTAAHLAAINRLGITPIHRRSFAPVRQTTFDFLSLDF